MNARKTRRRPKKRAVKPAAPPGPIAFLQAFGGLQLPAPAILTALAVAVGDSSLPVARAISWGLGLAAVALFFLRARERVNQTAVIM